MTNEQITEKVFELEKETAAQKEQLKTLFSRADKQDSLIEVLRTQTATIGALADGQARIEKKVNGVMSDVDEMKSKPGKRWENAVDVVFKVVLTAVMGLILTKMGLG